MTREMPKIAVIIPAYNQSRYLGYAIQSVLEQTFSDWEAVIVDDGSSDETRSVALSFHDPRLRYIYQENRGLSAARNAGIHNTTAPYLCFLDSDDMFLPGKLASQLAVLESSPEVGLVAGQAVPVDENGKFIGKIMDTPLPEQAELLVLENPLHVGSVLLERRWQEKAGFFDESLHSYEDWDMWLRLAILGCRMHYVNQPVSHYRFHMAQMTRIGAQMTTANFAVLDKLYSNHDLGPGWMDLHDSAYSQAHLRAAAQSYLGRQNVYAKSSIEEAVRLDPGLADNGGQRLAEIFSGWIDLPKSSRPLDDLENIYANLPDSLQALHKRKRQLVGLAAIQLAFYSCQQGDLSMTKYAVRRAFRNQPRYLFNRGALAIFVSSSLA